MGTTTCTGADVDFVHADLYDAVEALGGERFDLVFTGIGALCWLPSVGRWAQVVAALLRPGGRLFLREGHPVLWALDDEHADGPLALRYPYVETDAAFTSNRTLEWNHGLGEIVTALLDQGLRLTMLVEHDSVPWEALPGRMERLPLGEWRLADQPERLPHSYTLQAVKDG
jgi:SAM-dependent methyltransferase